MDGAPRRRHSTHYGLFDAGSQPIIISWSPFSSLRKTEHKACGGSSGYSCWLCRKELCNYGPNKHCTTDQVCRNLSWTTASRFQAHGSDSGLDTQCTHSHRRNVSSPCPGVQKLFDQEQHTDMVRNPVILGQTRQRSEFLLYEHVHICS